MTKREQYEKEAERLLREVFTTRDLVENFMGPEEDPGSWTREELIETITMDWIRDVDMEDLERFVDGHHQRWNERADRWQTDYSWLP